MLVGADAVIAVWVAAAALTLPRPRPPGLTVLARFLAIRALLEVAVLRAWTDPSPGTPSGASDDIEVLYIVGLVLTGIVVLAIWEVALGRWLVRSGHKNAAPHNGDADELHPSGAARTGTNGCGSQR